MRLGGFGCTTPRGLDLNACLGAIWGPCSRPWCGVETVGRRSSSRARVASSTRATGRGLRQAKGQGAEAADGEAIQVAEADEHFVVELAYRLDGVHAAGQYQVLRAAQGDLG